MLPFLKQKNSPTTMISYRKPDEKDPTQAQDDAPDADLEACAQDILRAVHSNDHKHLALALRAASECMESRPHEEANDYDSLNEKAAKEGQ